MKQRSRLKRRRDFDRVMSADRVLSGRSLVAFATPAADGATWRVGVAVSRRVKGSVRRNRLRRRLREAARTRLLLTAAASAPASYDVVLVGRPDAAELPMRVLEDDVARVRERLERRGR